MKKCRQAEGVFVAEGPRLVDELMAGGFECVYVAADPSQFSMDGVGMECDSATAEELRRVSTLETPQGVLAVFRQPRHRVDVARAMCESLCLALDEVQNPGNLGSIVRIADWFGIGDVFCSLGCADVYNPKTVQATMGALAHVRVHYVDLVDALHEARVVSAGLGVYGTFLNGENVYEKRLDNRGVIVMGNEGRGISPEVEAVVTERLTIPSYGTFGHTDSLNVAMATAVVCAEFRRQASGAARGGLSQ